MKRLLSFAALLLLLAAYAIGQTPTGTLQGAVTDPSGGIVTGAKVHIVNTKTGETKDLVTDSAGRFVQPFLLPSTYNVTVEASGFQKTAQNNIYLEVGQNRALKIELAVGQASTSVNVEATTPALDTTGATLGTVIENKRVNDLPLNGRNAFSLAALAPGVNSTGSGSTPYINGGRNATSEVQIDGITDILPENNVGNSSLAITPQVDAVQEFSVSTNALDAQYGRFGGGLINVVTKSGTNEFHGDVFDYLRNNVLDANDFFANRNGRPKSGFKRNQWGGVFGGPIVKNRTFFFVDFQGDNQRNQSIYTGTVPINAWRNGDFSNLRDSSGRPITIYDPLVTQADPADPTGNILRAPFAGNRVPMNRISPIAAKLLTFYPQPNTSPSNPFTNANNFINNGVDKNDGYQYDARVDHNITDNWRIFGRYSHSWGSDTPPLLYGNAASPSSAGGPSNSNAWAGDIDNTITLSPTVILNLRYGFTRTTVSRLPFSHNFDLTSLGFSQAYQQNAALNAVEFPLFQFGGAADQLGQNNYTDLYEAPATHDLIANVTKVFSTHTLKAGFEYRKILLNFTQFGAPSGQFSFDRNWTQGDLIHPNTDSGFPIATFLLGLPTGGYLSNDPQTATSNNYWAGYIQDDWKISQKFTLNWGLRYELEQPRTERYNRLSYFDFSAGSPLQGLVNPNACPACGNLQGALQFTNPNNRTQVPNYFFDFGPRIGFAWNITPKTVIRSGYGIAYAPSVYEAAGSSGSLGTQGFSASTGLNATLDNYRTINATLNNPFPGGFLRPTGSALGASTFLGQGIGGGSGSVFDSYRIPQVQQWNFNIQRELPSQITLEIGYTGQRGTHLPNGEGGTAYDQLPTSDLALGSQLNAKVANPFYGVITDPTSSLNSPTVIYNQLLRRYPQYTGVNSYRTPRSDSIYNALIVQANKRFTSNLSLSVAYTKSKSIDTASSAVNFIGPNAQSTGSFDAYNARLDRSVSAFDVPQNLVISYAYELPFGKGKRFANSLPTALNFFVAGWQANGILNFSSGTPVIIVGANNNTGLFTNTQRTNNNGKSAHISGGHTNQRINEWFDTSVFSQPASFTLGNTGRTLPDTRNPGVDNVDLSFFKNNYFGPEGRFNVQYRLEMFNSLNAVQFAAPDAGLNDGNFGQISSTAHAARQIQMALKFYF